LKVIFNIIRKRLFKKSRDQNNNVTHTNNKNHIHKNWTTFFTIPYVYISSISEKFKRFFRNNKLNSFIRNQKDKLTSLSQTNVVYRVLIVRNAMHSMKDRRNDYLRKLDEHSSYIERNTKQKSVISEHRLEHNHDFD